MKQSSFREDFFIIFMSFWITIISTRVLTFEYYKIFREFPIIYIYNTPIHHFLIGLLLVAGVILFKMISKKFSFLGLVFLGIGLGLITDEFYLLVTGNLTQDNIYWAGQNLAAIILLATVSYAVIKFLEWRKPKVPTRIKAHVNPENPHVTVVVPAFNEERYLPQNLASLVSQKYKDFELIVVDNNSTDMTSEIAKKYGAKVILCTEKGVGAARQAGFKAAKGTIIATTDADNILPNNWLTSIVKSFEKDEKLVAYGGLFRLYSGPLSSRIAVKYLAYPVFKIDKLFSGKWSLIAQNMAVKKSAFDKIGGFKNVQIAEDADLSHRMAEVGKVHLNPDFIVYASGRRVRHGLWYGVWSYAPNGFSRMFFKKHAFDKLPTVRQDNSLLAELSVVPLVISVIYLIFLFTTMNTSLGDAQERLLERTTSTIPIAKLREIANDLHPTITLEGIYKETKDYIFQEN